MESTDVRPLGNRNRQSALLPWLRRRKRGMARSSPSDADATAHQDHRAADQQPSGLPRSRPRRPGAAHRWRRVLCGGGRGRPGARGYSPGPDRETMFNTISTDDAYVSGHVTYVAPRVAGQVSRVLVDDNQRVKKGDLLVQLDRSRTRSRSTSRRRPWSPPRPT